MPMKLQQYCRKSVGTIKVKQGFKFRNKKKYFLDDFLSLDFQQKALKVNKIALKTLNRKCPATHVQKGVRS